jgi:hypothetical protein
VTGFEEHNYSQYNCSVVNSLQVHSFEDDTFLCVKSISRLVHVIEQPLLFQLETLEVDSISAVLVAPICSLLAATLHELVISYDQRVESLTEEEERSLQLLTSLQYLGIGYCPGLPSLPQGLHSLSSLSKLIVSNCPEIQSLPMGGLPSSLDEILVSRCSAKLHEEVTKLKETNPGLLVSA